MIQHSKPTLTTNTLKAIAPCFRSGRLSQGKYVRDFETALSRYIGVRDAVATNSGTSALHLALLALGVKKNDEVILPSYVCSSVLNAVKYTGATAVPADINESDLNISLETTRRQLTKRTRAIIVPHQFGFPADIKPFLKLGIPVIEDCAQGIGARYYGKQVGAWGTVAVFSFYATKMLTTGYGGMVASNNLKLLAKIRDLRDFDERDNYVVRYNYQLSDFAAALGLSQLRQLPGFIKRRRQIARYYYESLKKAYCELSAITQNTEPVFFRYIIRVQTPLDSFIKALRKKGVETKRPIYKPLHRYLGLNKKEFPVTEKIHAHAISLPIYPSLTLSQAGYVARLTKQTLAPR